MQTATQDRASRIDTALRHTFAPEVLEIEDESSRHAGHSGAAAGGQTHYRVLLVSGMFHGRSRVERTRLVNAALAAEFGSGLHALSLSLRAPGEPIRDASR